MSLKKKLLSVMEARDKESPKEVLEDFLFNEKMSVRDVAAVLDCSPPAICYWLKKYSIKPPYNKFSDYLKDNGFESIESFFMDDVIKDKTFKKIAEETGFCELTISRHYANFCKNGRKEDE